MTALLHSINRNAIDPAFRLLPSKMGSLNARAQLLKIGRQESKLLHRRQLVGSPPQPIGPAAGLWQFERGATRYSGIRGVMNHEATSGALRSLCAHFNVPFDSTAIWTVIQTNDVLAAGLARLNLYWNVKPLPGFRDEAGSWAYYVDCWRPGKPHPASWGGYHREVVDYLTT